MTRVATLMNGVTSHKLQRCNSQILLQICLRHDNIISIFLLRLVSSLSMCGKPPQSDAIKLKVTNSALENH